MHMTYWLVMFQAAVQGFLNISQNLTLSKKCLQKWYSLVTLNTKVCVFNECNHYSKLYQIRFHGIH